MTDYKPEDYIKYRIQKAKQTISETSILIEKRRKGDYNDFFDFDEESVLRLYQPSIEFIKAIEKLIEE